jgi:hypothetical protein
LMISIVGEVGVRGLKLPPQMGRQLSWKLGWG